MSIKISRILHAGYIFESGDTRVLFDPIFENPFSFNCYAFPSVRFHLPSIQNLRPSAIFISHHHDDHCSLESLNLLDRATPVFVFCLHEELIEMIRAIGFHEVHDLDLKTPIQIGEITITPMMAWDEDVDSIFHIKAGDLNVLNVVDSLMHPETLQKLKAEAPWDLVLWPFQTMRETAVLAPSRFPPAPPEVPEEWLAELKALSPRYVVPSSCQFVHESWSWYNHALFPITYRHFESDVRKSLPQTDVIKIDPGASILLDERSLVKSEPLSWVVRDSEDEYDYEYQPDVRVPATREIAMRFPPLSAAATEKVFNYCRNGIARAYRQLEPSESFSQSRVWQLSVFDHVGAEFRFSFRISNSEMVPLDGDDEIGPAWTTEVAIAKLYGALENGETLSSMYLRVNEVEIFEDPLIRSLFEGQFGNYQRAQLRRLRVRGEVVRR